MCSLTTGVPRTASVGFDLIRIIQTQPVRHPLYFQFKIIKFKRGRFFSVCPPLQVIDCAQPAEVLATTQKSCDRKAFSFWGKKLVLYIGVSSQGCNKNQTILLISFPVDFGSRIVLHIKNHYNILLHPTLWCFLSWKNSGSADWSAISHKKIVWWLTKTETRTM